MKKILIFMVILLIAVSSAFAATFVNPTSSSTISGNVVFNVTQAGADLNNCSISGSSAIAADSMTTILYNGTGISANTTVVTTALKDASDWTFTGTCYNVTGESYSITAITSVIIDNTAPILSLTSGQTSGATFAGTTAWTASCPNTRIATIQFGVTSYAMSISGSTCSFTPNGHVPPSVYAVTLTATDGLNSTSLAYSNVEISDKSRAGAAVAASGSSGVAITSGSGTSQVFQKGTDTSALVILAIIGVAIWLFTRNKKK